MAPSTDPRLVVVVTGANRGLGLGLTRHLLARGHAVVGACRRPADAEELASLPVLGCVALDVADDASVAALPAQVRALTDTVDVVVNNAGAKPFQLSLDAIDGETMLRTLRTNVVGPTLVTQALLPLLRPGARVVMVSSRLGSLQASVGTDYAYNASKAALNMVMTTMARELAGRIVPVSVHPGWVRTAMGGQAAPLDPDAATAELAALVERLGPDDAGCFYEHTGAMLPW